MRNHFSRHVLTIYALISCSKYAVVQFVGYDTCDIVPTSWITVEDGEDDTVKSWYPSFSITHPKKCLQLVRAAGPPDQNNAHQYDVKMMYLTGENYLVLIATDFH